jgi:hypothetical protein
VPAPAVVERLDVLENGGLQLEPVGPGAALDELLGEGGEERWRCSPQPDATPMRFLSAAAPKFQYAADVAKQFIDAARTASIDAVVRNVGGPSEHVADVIAAIEAAAPGAAGLISSSKTYCCRYRRTWRPRSP